MTVELRPSFPQAALDSWVLLSSGVVDTPTAGVSLVLPAQYQTFHLELLNVQFDDSDVSGLSCALSFDGGDTYLYDTLNEDAYFMIGYETDSTIGGTTTGSAAVGVGGSLIYFSTFTAFFTHPADPLFGTDVILDITPGSDTELTRVAFRSISSDTAANGKFTMASVTAFVAGAAATVPTDPARATNILIQSFGDGAAPQATGPNITAMDYVLFGVK